MSAADNSGPAFPAKVSICRDTGAVLPHQFGNNEFCATGMTLRDYFAAKAMQARLSGSNLANLDKRHAIAADAYAIADAMLAAREVTDRREANGPADRGAEDLLVALKSLADAAGQWTGRSEALALAHFQAHIAILKAEGRS